MTDLVEAGVGLDQLLINRADGLLDLDPLRILEVQERGDLADALLESGKAFSISSLVCHGRTVMHCWRA
jgi:hypothetical protein